MTQQATLFCEMEKKKEREAYCNILWLFSRRRVGLLNAVLIMTAIISMTATSFVFGLAFSERQRLCSWRSSLPWFHIVIVITRLYLVMYDLLLVWYEITYWHTHSIFIIFVEITFLHKNLATRSPMFVRRESSSIYTHLHKHTQIYTYASPHAHTHAHIYVPLLSFGMIISRAGND